MAPSSNKFLTGLLFFLIPVLLAGQTPSGEPRPHNEYKDPDQHDKFSKRRKIVGAWQINQLKTGALVVRLKTNRMAIDALRNQGNEQQASQLEAESFVINKNTMFAYLDQFKFCKVYFISSNLSDSLLHGTRKGIFLDTNQRVDPMIEMTEKFYIIAERDYAYNSSIGFVPEIQAENTIEKGNPVKQMAVVLKNKYGHQLKNPFPHAVSERVVGAGYDFPVTVTPQQNGFYINYTVNKKSTTDLENDPTLHRKKHDLRTTVAIPKHLTYDKIARAVAQLNGELSVYFRSSPPPDITLIPEDVKQFLY